MTPGVPLSYRALDDAIGTKRGYVARVLGIKPSTLKDWLLPQPSFDHPRDNGRPNPIDKLLGLTGYKAIAGRVGLPSAEHPEIIRQFLADAWDADLVARHAPAERGQLPIADATLVAAAMEKLGTETRRRKPKMTEADLLDLRDSLTDGIHALVAREIERRKERTT